MNFLNMDLLRSRSGKVDDRLIMQLYAKNMPIGLTEARWLTAEATKLFAREPSLLYIEEPLVIVGDIHGQLGDLYKIIELGGKPRETKYLFMGDYVDRGEKGVEVLMILFTLKVKFPNYVFLLRGNHESRMATDLYGFRAECLRKYNEDLYKLICEAFDQMPLAAVVNGHFFVVHGGISPQLTKANDLNKVNRQVEPPPDGMITDLLWSDPTHVNKRVAWQFNAERNCSFLYGFYEVDQFLKSNNLFTIVRAHQVVPDGFECFNWGSAFPMVVTIFSAADYGNTFNFGSVMKLRDGDMKVNQFDFYNKSRAVIFEEFGDAFAFTAPFIEYFLEKMKKGYFEFTNDAVVEQNNNTSIFSLSRAILKELNIPIETLNEDELKQIELSKSERNFEEEKRTRRISNKNMIDTLASQTFPETSEVRDQLFETVIERRRSDHFKKQSEKEQVNSDVVFEHSPNSLNKTKKPTK